MPYYVDTETCGLHGMPVLLQYALDDGPIILWNLWREPIYKTLELIKDICEEGIIGFNLAFDWFHIVKFYTTFCQHDDLTDWPIDVSLEKVIEYEYAARFGPCVKPKSACDLMLHARKGPYQSTMDRHDIRINRVPIDIANDLANELEARIPLKDIYFARFKDKRRRKWQVYDLDDTVDFKDICLKFAP